jgi:hypothetical protein
MAWKYIMVENGFPGGTRFLIPVIFPDKLIHSDVYANIKSIMPGWEALGVKAFSAGKIEHIRVEGLGGESETLRLKSHPEDERIIKNYSYLHGIR